MIELQQSSVYTDPLTRSSRKFLLTPATTTSKTSSTTRSISQVDNTSSNATVTSAHTLINEQSKQTTTTTTSTLMSNSYQTLLNESSSVSFTNTNINQQNNNIVNNLYEYNTNIENENTKYCSAFSAYPVSSTDTNYDDIKDKLMTPIFKICLHTNLDKYNNYNDWCMSIDDMEIGSKRLYNQDDQNGENNYGTQQRAKGINISSYTNKNTNNRSIDDKPYVYQHFNNWRLHLIAYKQNKIDAIMKPRLLQIYNNGFINTKIDENLNEDRLNSAKSNEPTERPIEILSAKKQIFPMIRPINYNMSFLARKQKMLTLSVPIMQQFKDYNYIRRHDSIQKLPALYIHNKRNAKFQIPYMSLLTKEKTYLNQMAQQQHQQQSTGTTTTQVKQNELCYDDTFLKNSNIALINKLNSLKRPNTTIQSFSQLDHAPTTTTTNSTTTTTTNTHNNNKQPSEDKIKYFNTESTYALGDNTSTAASTSSTIPATKSANNIPKSIIFPFNIDIKNFTPTSKNELKTSVSPTRKYKILKKDPKKSSSHKSSSVSSQQPSTLDIATKTLNEMKLNQFFEKTRIDTLLFKNK